MAALRALVGIAGFAGALVACAALLDLPPLEVVSDEGGTTPPTPGPDGAVADARPDGSPPPCTDVNPAAEWCARCGVGCADGATCGTFDQACADGGAQCCLGYQCRSGKCSPCAGDGGSCGSASCCSPLRCRSTDYQCVPCGVVGATCGAAGNVCCSGNCNIIDAVCR